MLEQNDEWQLQRRHMQVEAMAESTPEFNANNLMSILHERREYFHLHGQDNSHHLGNATNN